MFRLPSVTTNGLMPTQETKKPLKIPTSSPTPSPTASPATRMSQAGAPAAASAVVASAVATLMTDTAMPSDRSNPPVRITTIWAEANSSR